MSVITTLARRGRALLLRAIDPFRRGARERELRAELDAHLQLHIDDNLRAGLSPAEARRVALLALGGLEAAKEHYRDRRGLPQLDTLLQDLRQVFRLIRRSPGFSLVVTLSLALGIGANTTMFSMLDAVLLRELPVRAPEQLALFAESDKKLSGSWTYPVWEQIHQRDTLVAGACAWAGAGNLPLRVSARDGASSSAASGGSNSISNSSGSSSDSSSTIGGDHGARTLCQRRILRRAGRAGHPRPDADGR